jgi:fructose transport system substrate-binding protein
MKSLRSIRFTTARRLTAASLAGACLVTTVACSSSGSNTDTAAAGAGGGSVTIGIVELNLDNPFFGTLEKATESAATAKGWKVMKAEAKVAGDSATQVAAIENMIAQNVKAIVLDPANATALNNVVKRARDKGIFVVTVNATLSPAETADATFATDNVVAGELIGKWAKAKAPANPRIALLDYDLSDGPAKGRHDGFLAGYGITLNDPAVAGSGLTKGSIDTGQKAMENLLSANPDINVVYTINEPVARGAATALKNKGSNNALVVSVDGACSGVQYVKDGVIGATAMQFPDKMGAMAVDSIDAFLKNGTKPAKVLNDSGSTLITDSPVAGLESQNSDWGLQHCWGTK